MLKTVSTSTSAVTGALVYQGTWNASTNTPTLASGVGTKGYYYVVSVAGSTNLDGITDWQVSDWAVFNGTAWQKVDNSEVVYVSNVATGTGLTGGPITTTGTISIANTAVTAGTYGNASYTSQVTINAQGQITNAQNVAISIASGNVTGLGTMATQNANAVVITGGTINSVTENASTYTNVSISSGNATLTNVNATLTNTANVQVRSLTGYVYANNTANATASTTIPNSGLANSTTTLGNATLTLGSTTTSVGNLTLTNVTISSGSVAINVANVTSNTAASATMSTASLPLVPQGYLYVNLNGTQVKVPYYAV